MEYKSLWKSGTVPANGFTARRPIGGYGPLEGAVLLLRAVAKRAEPCGPEAWAYEHLELTDDEHDVRLEFHEFDPEYITPEEEQGEFYPFPEADFPEEPVDHEPY